MSTTDTRPSGGQWPRVSLAGLPTDLLDSAGALEIIADYASGNTHAQLAVISANLDHLHHFRGDTSWLSKPRASKPGPSTNTIITPCPEIHWLTLLDGAPLVHKAQQLTGETWPRLSGSDLIHPLLELAANHGWHVGFLGGTTECHWRLQRTLAEEFPTLMISGCWAPERSTLTDASASSQLAADVAAAGTDILVVGLGKPRQEHWIETYGTLTRARVLLAFGAVVDFLAGRIQRAPKWVANNGMEWAWRLSREPRRLARRYLVQGPPAYVHLKRESTSIEHARTVQTQLPVQRSRKTETSSFAGPTESVDVCAVIVTHNSANHILDLLRSLRAEAKNHTIRVVICDNDSTDRTLHDLDGESDVKVVPANGNLGYAGGINLANKHVGDCRAVLVLNADLTVQMGTISAMLARLQNPGVGVVVPRILDTADGLYPSIRREPSIFRTIGDAALGSRLTARPNWLSETDWSPHSYTTARKIDWATGAALLIRKDVAQIVGPWDEQFFLYSEETDFFRRVRAAGYQIWFEPTATVHHQGGGSGSWPELAALMSVNRIRYAETYHSIPYATAFRAVVALAELVRSYDPVHRSTLAFVISRQRWAELPQAMRRRKPEHSGSHRGAVIIPAHNESNVIRRALIPLSELAARGILEVIVVCNGCTDRTSEIARQVPGIRVIEINRPSKIAAINTGDECTNAWPRIYLDADIEATAQSILATIEALSDTQTLYAARPTATYDINGADFLVRRYYRARSRVPALHRSLWGAGIFGLTHAGHQRIGGTFPQVIGDDLFTDRQFTEAEKAIIRTVPVKVNAPGRLPTSSASYGATGTHMLTLPALLYRQRPRNHLEPRGAQSALSFARSEAPLVSLTPLFMQDSPHSLGFRLSRAKIQANGSATKVVEQIRQKHQVNPAVRRNLRETVETVRRRISNDSRIPYLMGLVIKTQCWRSNYGRRK